MKQQLNELQRLMTDTTTLLLGEIHEKNRLLLETQQLLLAQQRLTTQAYRRIEELERHLT